MADLLDDIISRIKTDKDKITKGHIKALKDFDEINRLKGLRTTTRSIQIKMMIQFAKAIGKELDTVTVEDIQIFLSQLSVVNSTLGSWKIIIKKWYKNNPKIMDAECLKSTKNANREIKSSQMLTEDEVKRMIDATVNTQNRAIIGALWETGARVGELVNCNISDLIHIGDIPKITLDGKTGVRERELVISAKLINRWLEEHPFQGQPDKPLFISKNHARFHKRITTHGIGNIVRKIKDDANIQKRVTPHTFRSSRATALAPFMAESEMREYFGWARNSDMPSIYIHLSAKHVNEKYRQIVSGEKEKLEPKRSILMSVPCPRCSKTNDVSSQYCSSCMLPLSQREVKRDLQILTTFRSPYAKKILDIDVDEEIHRFYDFRNQVIEMVTFDKAFNGSREMSIHSLRNKLGWTKEKFNELMNYLLKGGIVKVEDGLVRIQTYKDPFGNQKSVFDNFILFQELYLNK